MRSLTVSAVSLRKRAIFSCDSMRTSSSRALNGLTGSHWRQRVFPDSRLVAGPGRQQNDWQTTEIRVGTKFV